MSARGGKARAAGLIIGFAAIVFPFYWTLVASVTSEADLFHGLPLVPLHPVLDHYRALFAQRRFWVPIRNSLVVAGTTTLLCVSLGPACA